MNQDKINPANYIAYKRPGKFEGEQPATEFYYSQWLNGDGEAIFTESGDEETEGTLFYITAEEAEAFNLPIGHTFLLWEDNQGFAFGEVYPTSSEATASFHSKI